jgi:hypothetical protein
MSSHAPVACGVSRLRCPELLFETATVTGGTNLNNGAWCAINWDDFLGRQFRGEDLLVPGVDYLLPRDRYADYIQGSLHLIFDGNVNAAGVSHAPNTVMHGLELNRRAFITNVATPPDTRTLTLTLTDGSTIAGPVRTIDFLWARGEVMGMARAVWTFRLPEGLT